MKSKIVVLGAGESGVGAALLAKAKGFDVFVSDYGMIAEDHKEELAANAIPFEEGIHTPFLILEAQEIVKSPGIPDTAPIVVEARERGIKVISEIEFAARYTKAKFIAITGSNGKTTATLLAHHLIKSAGFNVGLAGNIGQSLAKQVIDDDYDYFVVELSSFQLDGMYEFKADIAILLNITPDHLDRYDDNFDNYVDSKFRITQNQGPNDYLITFVDDPVIKKEISARKPKAFPLMVSLEGCVLNGSYLKHDKLMFNIHNHITKVFSIETNHLTLRGRHNMVNIMSATMAALAAGVPESVVIKALGSFKNAPHRLEQVAAVSGVRYINDSKATNVDSVKYALDSFEKPIIWVAGGVDKGNDYSLIEEQVFEKVKMIIAIGTDNSKLRQKFDNGEIIFVESESMDDVVDTCSEVTTKGDVVLLSPACASFDRFANYEDRGTQFKNAIDKLKDNSSMKFFKMMLTL